MAKGKDRKQYEHRVIDIARVTRVMAGGRRFSFRATVVVGDQQGNVGVGTSKGSDTSAAVEKAYNSAVKNMVFVPTSSGTVDMDTEAKFGGARVLVKPAPEGHGIVAGGAVRTVFDLAGIRNVTSKMLGSNNKLNNAQATIRALVTTQGYENARSSTEA
ncbi:MAG: 30S ribosomal protein S5 [Parcubacteria group bacterium SW_4_49_11]|jgi:small subunit ribosomal protein S5|nr:MAG: 30S ribosomal protein S5 [Parcubacteria group bacterium SW_4_49_11]